MKKSGNGSFWREFLHFGGGEGFMGGSIYRILVSREAVIDNWKWPTKASPAPPQSIGGWGGRRKYL